ncbi:MAG: N-acetylmuramoyl-L-alanine amidase [Paludibacteraceae bacterium]|nr:N-acetylmuramoyl-L-alanine amidase [Paludibacteraceae bacterium]
MKKRIIIHATNTISDLPVTLDDIMAIYSEDPYSDPMPYHYIINIDGRILKGRPDRFLCGHCGKFSRDSISIAYAGGLLPETYEQYNTLNPQQETSLRFLLKTLRLRHPDATITGANTLLYPTDDPTFNEPYFDVPKWWSENQNNNETGNQEASKQ